MSEMRKFVITGTGRCGTKWCATALRNAGIYCGHENVFATAMMPAHGTPRWGEFEGDSSLAAVPYLGEMHDVRKVLMVRNPFRFVSSMLKVGPFMTGSQPAGLVEYITEMMPDVMRSDTEVEAALRFWLHWNALGHVRADVTLRIESTTQPMLLDAIERIPRWMTYPIGIVNHAANYSMGEYTIDGVPAALIEAVRNQAARFGYTEEELVCEQ